MVVKRCSSSFLLLAATSLLFSCVTTWQTFSEIHVFAPSLSQDEKLALKRELSGNGLSVKMHEERLGFDRVGSFLVHGSSLRIDRQIVDLEVSLAEIGIRLDEIYFGRLDSHEYTASALGLYLIEEPITIPETSILGGAFRSFNCSKDFDLELGPNNQAKLSTLIWGEESNTAVIQSRKVSWEGPLSDNLIRLELGSELVPYKIVVRFAPNGELVILRPVEANKENCWFRSNRM